MLCCAVMLFAVLHSAVMRCAARGWVLRCMLCGAALHWGPEQSGTEGCAAAAPLLSLTSPPFPLACPGASVLPFSLTSLPVLSPSLAPAGTSTTTWVLFLTFIVTE